MHAEDYVRVNNNIIAACGNGVTVCPLVMVPLSGIKNTRTIEQLADLDSWIMSANLPRSTTVGTRCGRSSAPVQATTLRRGQQARFTTCRSH